MRKILYAVFLFGCCASLLSGCIKEKYTVPSEKGDALVQLNIGTRAVEETDGIPTNNETVLHSLRVYAFVDGQPAGHFYTKDGEQSLVPDAPDHVFHHDTEGGLLCRGQRSGHGNTGFFCLIDGKHNGNPVEPFYIHEAEYVERFADVLQTDGNNRLDAVVG